MFLIRRAVQRTNQPQHAVGLDFSNRFARRATSVANASVGAFNLVTGRPATVSSSAPTRSAVGGAAVWSFNAANSQFIELPVPTGAQTECTAFVVVEQGSSTLVHAVSTASAGAAEGIGVLLGLSGAGLANGRVASTAGQTDTTERSGLNDGRLHVHIVSRTAGERAIYSVDGVVVQDVSVTGTISHTQNLRAASRGTTFATCRIAAFGYLTAGLGQADHQALGRNIWQLFAPIERSIWVPSALSGPQTVVIGTATETDSAQPIGAAHRLALGTALESDAAQAITAAQARVIGIAAETDSALPITAPGVISVAIGTATETDEAQPIRAGYARVLGQATESDIALAVSPVLARTLSIALETDAALPITTPSTGGAGAADVWAYDLGGVSAGTMLAALYAALGRIERIEKFLRNKQITDPVTGRMVVYDDDGVTVLAQGDLFEDVDAATRYRGQGADRRERLT